MAATKADDLLVMTAHGGSMFPFVPDRSRLTIAPGDASRVGDIVCLLGESGAVVAHRVIARANDGQRLFVRGDRGGAVEEVPPGALLGRVVRVQKGLLQYRTDHLLGRGLAHIAVHQPRMRERIITLVEGLLVALNRR